MLPSAVLAPIDAMLASGRLPLTSAVRDTGPKVGAPVPAAPCSSVVADPFELSEVGVAPAPPPRVIWFSPSAADDAIVPDAVKPGMPPEVPEVMPMPPRATVTGTMRETVLPETDIPVPATTDAAPEVSTKVKLVVPMVKGAPVVISEHILFALLVPVRHRTVSPVRMLTFVLLSVRRVRIHGIEPVPSWVCV